MRQDSVRTRIAALRSEGANVGHERGPSVASSLHADGRPPAQLDRSWISLIIYAVASGLLAVTVGAVASLVAHGPQRLALWAAVTGVTAVVGGVAHESGLIISCGLACARWLRRLARLSPTS